MRLTREQYEASGCLGKSESYSLAIGKKEGDPDTKMVDLSEYDFFGMPMSNGMTLCRVEYNICFECLQFERESSKSGSEKVVERTSKCLYTLRERCTDHAEGPIAADVLRDFLNYAEKKYDSEISRDDYVRYLQLLVTSECRDWTCACEYWEIANVPEGRELYSAWTTTHGISSITQGAATFFSFFAVRKCMMDDSEKKICGEIFIQLLKYCKEKGYMKAERVEELISEIVEHISFKGEAIARMLDALHHEGYWEKKRLKRKRESSDDEEEYFDNGEKLESEMGLCVTEITKEGWVFSCMYDFSSEPMKAMLYLPPRLSKLGKKGMSITCMGLEKQKGIWHPYDMYGGMYNNVCGGVYPP